MKKIAIVWMILLVVLTGAAMAGTISDKRVELSGAASYISLKYQEAAESSSVLNLSLRVGIFLYRGLEFEPEFSFTLPEDGDRGAYVLLGNLAYNFEPSKKVALFLLAGGGFGNGSKFFSWIMDADTNVSVLNFGGGIKIFVSDAAAVRLEYRWSKYSGDGDYVLGQRTDSEFKLGFSVFL